MRKQEKRLGSRKLSAAILAMLLLAVLMPSQVKSFTTNGTQKTFDFAVTSGKNAEISSASFRSYEITGDITGITNSPNFRTELGFMRTLHYLDGEQCETGLQCVGGFCCSSACRSSACPTQEAAAVSAPAGGGGAGIPWAVRWRYVTSSDHPTIWVIANADGTIASVWEAEDPVHQGDYPENPSPLESQELKPGQRVLSVEPPTINELKVLMGGLSAEDRKNILEKLGEYLNKRGWHTSFKGLNDIAAVAPRYEPSARQWAYRFFAEHFHIAPGSAIQIFFRISAKDKLKSVADSSAKLEEYRTNLASAKVQQNTRISGADIAEWYLGDGNVEAGDMVTLDRASGFMRKVVSGEDIFGVIATSPQQVLGKKLDDNDIRISLIGRVPVKVNLEGGPIKIGDKITSSPIAGVGTKATNDGYTIGTALEPLASCDNVCKILVFVNLDYSTFNGAGGSSQAKKLCLEEVCVTKEQLKMLLERNGLGDTSDNFGGIREDINYHGKDVSAEDSKYVINDMIAFVETLKIKFFKDSSEKWQNQ